MPFHRWSCTFAASLCAILAGAAPTFAALTANASISAVQNGSNYNYTITLTNTGNTNIGTFWFAWTPPGAPTEYDFLPHAPSATGQPAGWFAPVPLGFPGYSIEYYTLNSANQITPGNSATFTFTSSDSPATLQANSLGIFPITTSFIYAGAPEVGSFTQVNPAFIAAAPEPASLTLLGLGGAALLLRRRKTT